ncbi:MAG: HupE/UreJ family protein [Sediminicola sp.]|tara:strand:- start:42283 stop:42867 length:585 start_codon:yes stop_codon:yes gene_type:complete
METFWFYIQMGLDHVLDLSAYDHILFLSALAVPFTFRSWKKVLLLATVFTIAHCLSLALSAYKVLTVNVALIEFLIPVTILFTAAFDLFYARKEFEQRRIAPHLVATAFFGLIHGFGFSNYFKMLMAGEERKLVPLLGFATGIELSQILIIIGVLLLSYLAVSIVKIKKWIFVTIAAIAIILIVLPMLANTYPW